MTDTGRIVDIDYTNWRGERRVRPVMPMSIEWKSTEWHTEPQWLLEAIDMEDGVIKDFAMKDIHEWRGR